MQLKALVLKEVEKLEVEDIPEARRKKGDVLIKVMRGGICGTDLHLWKGQWKAKLPLVLGHEISGYVEEPDEDGIFKKGQHVVFEPNVICHHCYFCRLGEPNCFCTNLRGFGVEMDGGFTELISVPLENVYAVPDSLSWEEAATVEPLACAVRGIDRLSMKVGDRVAVVGAGPMGILMIQLVKMMGASKVLAVEPRDDRREAALKFGADEVATPSEALDKALEMTDGIGVDKAVEAVGSPAAINTAYPLVRRGGTLEIFGVSPQDAKWTVSPFDLYNRELTIVTSYRSPLTFERAIQAASSGRINLKDMVTHVFPLEKAPEAFEMLERGEGKAIKVDLAPRNPRS